MKKMHRRIVAGIVFTSLLVFLSATSVSAYSATDVTKKALMQALSACYDGNGFVSEFKTVGAYTGASSLYNKKNTAGSELPLPTGDAFHKIHDSDLSCKDLFEGHDSLLGGKIDNVYKFAEKVNNNEFTNNLSIIKRIIRKEMGEIELIEIKSLGEFFNPEVHKCIGVEKDRTKEKDQIISVIENGYMLRGKVIRPASVIIAR